jgi:DNA-binding winged helix-turn-helix (wHTH) protein/tetratricopeptide (TPR) repeat protein
MSRHLYEFGRFQVDSVKRLLRRDGQTVPLTPKAFDTLLALVERSGQVVEKDELMRSVWGETVVEEVGLARNVSVLRKTLGERPGEHQYIVTVPGHGYRFVEPVRTVAIATAAHPAVIVETHTVSRLVSEVVTEEEISEDVTEGGVAADSHIARLPVAALVPARKRSPARLGLVLAAIVALVAAGLFVYSPPRPALTERDSILIADFVNSAGDPAFDRVLQHSLAAQLEQSPFLNIFPDARVREALGMMGRSADEPLTLPLAREISLRHGIKVALAGDITKLGQHYVLTLEAINTQTGEGVARAQTEAPRKEDVLRQLSEAVRDLREKLGESLSSIQQFYTPIEQATTASLEALQAYSLGREQILQHDADAARRYYQRAVEIDPNFAIAWNALADLQYFDPPTAEASIARAYALRDRTSEIERIRITLTWHEIVTRDLSRVLEEAELFRRRYQQSWRPYWTLAVNMIWLGQNGRALPHARELVRLNPTVPSHHFLLAEALARLDEPDEARNVCGQAGSVPGLFSICGYLLERHASSLPREAKDAAGLYWQSVRAGQDGQWQRAQQLAAEGRDLPTREFETRPRLIRQLVVTGALVGDCRKSWPLESLSHLPLQVDAIVARALCGDVTSAGEFIDRYQESYPQDTLLHGLYLPTARAALALGRQQPKQVITALQSTDRFSGVRDFWPTWLRGEAYLQEGDGAAAALEFKRILAHRGLYLDSPMLPLAHLGLARAAAQVGDLAESRASYGRFFEIWRDADADLPILLTARQEYAQLPSIPASLKQPHP